MIKHPHDRQRGKERAAAAKLRTIMRKLDALIEVEWEVLDRTDVDTLTEVLATLRGVERKYG